jgi:hypothetical protein
MSKDDLKLPDLNLTQGNTGILEQVTQLDLNDPFKTLGIHKTISGNQTKEIKEMKKKSDACARGILSVSVTNFEAWTGLFTIWHGQLNCPLGATCLTEKSCQKTQTKAINASLSKCGFSSETPRSVVFWLALVRRTRMAPLMFRTRDPTRDDCDQAPPCPGPIPQPVTSQPSVVPSHSRSLFLPFPMSQRATPMSRPSVVRFPPKVPPPLPRTSRDTVYPIASAQPTER